VHQHLRGTSVSIFRVKVYQVGSAAGYVLEELENRPRRVGVSSHSGIELGAPDGPMEGQDQERMMEEQEDLEREMTEVHFKDM
jgi:hypothetical protein